MPIQIRWLRDKALSKIYPRTHEKAVYVGSSGETLDEVLPGKLAEPSSGMAVGKTFRIASIDENGHAVIEAVEYGALNGVKVAGTDLVKDANGKVNIPIATGATAGVVTVDASNGVAVIEGGRLIVSAATEALIDNRIEERKPITPDILNYAVKAALTDANRITGLTDTEKSNAWGVFANIKTSMDAIAVAGAEYYLGEQSSVSITLPNATAGQKIIVVFYSGSTATTLTIANAVLGEVPVPTANSRVELNFLYDSVNWCLLSNTMEVTA